MFWLSAALVLNTFYFQSDALGISADRLRLFDNRCGTYTLVYTQFSHVVDVRMFHRDSAEIRSKPARREVIYAIG